MPIKTNDKSYIFYDIETTGTNPCFDQIIQFAAIRCNAQLEATEHIEFTVKLNPDCIPQAEAFLTHRIPLENINNGLTELEAAQQIHRMFNRPNSISIGYNSLAFDDVFLRFTFFRNLLPTYTHQYLNGCSRMDLFPITAMYQCFCPQAIKWPTIDDKLSLKLENLNALNNWSSGPAHTAMADVEATLGLARSLAEHQQMWDFCCDYFNKKTDQARTIKLANAGARHSAQLHTETISASPAQSAETSNQLSLPNQQHPLALCINPKLGYANNFQAPALLIGQHRIYSNQNIWLRLDTTLELSDLDALKNSAYIIRKKYAEAPFILPYTEKYNKHINTERQQQVSNNLQAVTQQKDIFHAFCEYILNEPYPTVANLDIDAALYATGFPSRQDTQLCREFHNAEPDDKKGIIDLFSDKQLQQRAWRLLYRLDQKLLSEKEAVVIKQHLTQIYGKKPEQATCDYRNQARTNAHSALEHIQQLLIEIDALENNNKEEDKNILKALANHLQKQIQAAQL